MAIGLSWNGVTICGADDFVHVVEEPRAKLVTKAVGYPGTRGMTLKVVDDSNTMETRQRVVFGTGGRGETSALFSSWANAEALLESLSSKRREGTTGTLAWGLNGYSGSLGGMYLESVKARIVNRRRGSDVCAVVFSELVFVRYAY